jgi:hypothetical protein
VDNVFTPSLMFTPTDQTLDSSMPNLDSSSFSFLTPHVKMKAADYQDFRKEADGKSGQAFWGVGEVEPLDSVLSAPQPVGKAPPGHEDSQFSSAILDEDSESLAAMHERRRQAQQHDEDMTKLHNVMTGHRVKEGLTSSGNSITSHGRHSVQSGSSGGAASLFGAFSSAPSPRSRTHLPLINNPPRMPENTVGALLTTIHQDARQAQREGSAHGVPHLSMSTSLDSLSLSKMDQYQQNGSSKGDSRAATAATAAMPQPTKSFAKGGHSKVVQVSLNDHGNFSR